LLIMKFAASLTFYRISQKLIELNDYDLNGHRLFYSD
jgi:hypothetical protein